jgi:hypothetical protein
MITAAEARKLAESDEVILRDMAPVILKVASNGECECDFSLHPGEVKDKSDALVRLGYKVKSHPDKDQPGMTKCNISW